MKFNKTYLLIGVLFLVVLFACLGNYFREGLDTNKEMKNSQENHDIAIQEFKKNKAYATRENKEYNDLNDSEGLNSNNPNLGPGGTQQNIPNLGPGGTQQMPVQGAESESSYINQVHNNSAPYDYYSGQGVPRSQIPSGDEDLYILKSEIVPPVCPVCPPAILSLTQDNSKCPACPPCGRCPEPAFDCKKVPNYSSNDDDYMPRPVLNDFSQFGM